METTQTLNPSFTIIKNTPMTLLKRPIKIQ